MKIKFDDIEEFLEYYYKQQSQGVLPSEDIVVKIEERNGALSIFSLSFIDSEDRLCKIEIHESFTKIAPKLIKEMTLQTRITKKEN